MRRFTMSEANFLDNLIEKDLLDRLKDEYYKNKETATGQMSFQTATFIL